MFWDPFKSNLYVRFRPTQFKDFFGKLTKLHQIDIVREYQIQFEKLLVRAERLTSDQQVRCFSSGLKEHIKMDVLACRPTTLSAAIGLARLYESRMNSIKQISSLESRRGVSMKVIVPIQTQ